MIDKMDKIIISEDEWEDMNNRYECMNAEIAHLNEEIANLKNENKCFREALQSIRKYGEGCSSSCAYDALQKYKGDILNCPLCGDYDQDKSTNCPGCGV